MTFPQRHQTELNVLAELAGVSAPPGVFRIVLELLALQVSPEDTYTLLKQLCLQSSNNEEVGGTKNILQECISEDST